MLYTCRLSVISIQLSNHNDLTKNKNGKVYYKVIHMHANIHTLIQFIQSIV